MDELYSVMETMLEVSYKLECVEAVSDMPFENMDNISKNELLSVIKLIHDSVNCTIALNRSAVSIIDRYIALNAKNARKDEL